MLIVEDGTMPEGADSYASLADADAILVSRGIWQETPAELPDDVIARKEAAIIRATDWLNTLVWKGDKPDWRRVMAWPRIGITFPDLGDGIIVPDDIVPDAVRRACIEIAGVIHGGTDPLAPVERGGMVQSISESSSKGVDVIQKSTSRSLTYADDAPVEAFYPAVAAMLEPFLRIIPGKKRHFAVVEIGRG